jgi:hypothetical protein
MKILFGDFNAKVGRENIFNPTIGNDSLHKYINDHGVSIVNSAASNNLVLIRRCSRTETFIRTPRPLLMGRFTTILSHIDRKKMAF